MANRFQRLFQLPSNLTSEGSPVLLVTGVLSKDTVTSSIVAQMKFKSVSEKPIKCVKISLSAYDATHSEVNGVHEYQYCDLYVTNGQEFGANKAILLPDVSTRFFSVTSLQVVFEDDTYWLSTDKLSSMPVPAPVPASSVPEAAVTVEGIPAALKMPKKKILVIAAAFLVLLILLIALFAGNKKITIDKLLALTTREDVVSLLGQNDDDSYEVKYEGRDFTLFMDYDGDEVEDWSMSFYYPGSDELSFIESLDFIPSNSDISAANALVNDLLEIYTDKFGYPEKRVSSIDTVHYTWNVDGIELSLIDNTGNVDMTIFGAIEVDADYNP